MIQDLTGVGRFAPRDTRDADVWQRLCDFVTSEPRAFSRDPAIGGHVTGSAFVLSPDRNAVLLTLHRKLDLWLQLGGHCDGIADAAFVAQKEAYEESGLSRVDHLSDTVFDVDIHEIPANAKEPAHLHYDARFLMQAAVWDIQMSSESKALEWVPLARLEDYTREASILRMAARLP